MAGAPAYLAVWDAAQPPTRPGASAASTSPERLLDEWLEALVAPDRDLPRCELTIVAGRAAHDPFDEFAKGTP